MDNSQVLICLGEKCSYDDFIFKSLLMFMLMCGRYILEGKELEFYMKKIQRKKGKGAGAA